MHQFFVKLAGVDGFCHKVIHAGFKARIAIFLEGIRRHGQNRQVAPFGQCAQGQGGFQAIHFRHLDVHQDQVKRFALRMIWRVCLHAFLRLGHCHHAVFGHSHFNCHIAQQLYGDIHVDGVVFGQQHPRSGRSLFQLLFRRQRLDRIRHDRWCLDTFQPGGKPEDAAATRCTLYARLTFHGLCQTAGNGEPQPGAAIFACCRSVTLLKRGEQLADFLLADPNAGVFHLKAHQNARTLFLQQFCAQADGTVLGKFHRIAGVIQPGLAQSSHVTAQPGWHALHIGFDAQPFAACVCVNQCIDLLRQFGQSKLGPVELHPARFNFGKIENVVDDGQQVLC